MKIKNIFIFFVTLLFSSLCFSETNDNFRGVKFGDSAANYSNKLIFYHNGKDGVTKFYKAKDEKMSIGNTPINGVIYVFSDDKFNTAMLNADKHYHFDLLESLRSRYGYLEQENRYIDKYRYSDQNIIVSLDCNNLREDCSITIMSQQYLRDKENKRVENAEKSKSDF